MTMIVDTYTPEQVYATNFPREQQEGIAGATLTKYMPVIQDGTSFKWLVATTEAHGICMQAAVDTDVITVVVAGTFNYDLIDWDSGVTTELARTHSIKAPLFVRPLSD